MILVVLIRVVQWAVGISTVVAGWYINLRRVEP